MRRIGCRYRNRPAASCGGPDLPALLARRRRGRIRKCRRTRSAAGWPSRATIPARPARADELRGDAVKALSLIPGRHRFNLHAMYAETGGKRVERNELAPEHFARWIDWCKEHKLGMDFNPTYFAHPKAADGMTLSHADAGHPQVLDRARHCLPQDRRGDRRGPGQAVRHQRLDSRRHEGPAGRPRRAAQRLTESLDEIFAAPVDRAYNLDAVESKLFGIGSESYVVGSHEFYLGYAITRKKLLDARHGPLPSDGNDRRQDFGRVRLPGRDPAARQPRHPLGQRPRGDRRRLAAGDRPGAGPRRFPRAHARRPGLLRRLDQSRGGLGDRRAGDAQGPVDRALGADRDAPRAGALRRLHGAAGPAGRAEDAALWRPFGIITACSKTCPSGRPGSAR